MDKSKTWKASPYTIRVPLSLTKSETLSPTDCFVWGLIEFFVSNFEDGDVVTNKDIADGLGITPEQANESVERLFKYGAVDKRYIGGDCVDRQNKERLGGDKDRILRVNNYYTI